MNVRWTGEGDRELADPQVTMKHGEWVDLPADVARSLEEQDGFEVEEDTATEQTPATEPAPAGDEKE